MKRTLGQFLAAFILMLSAADSFGLKIQQYEANINDRFYSGADRAFIGDPLDWSGVSIFGGTKYTNQYYWATMISPTYFLAAAHLRPTPGGQVTFYPGNNRNATPEVHTVDPNFWCQTSLNGSPSDVWLGRLTTPVSSAIATYPILQLPSDSDYIGQSIFVAGQGLNGLPYNTPFVVGRNHISDIIQGVISQTREMEYVFNGSFGNSTAALTGGDSGGPSFVNVNGQLKLVGLHYYSYGTWSGAVQGDSFVPFYTNQLAVAMQIGIPRGSGGGSASAAVIGGDNFESRTVGTNIASYSPSWYSLVNGQNVVVTNNIASQGAHSLLFKGGGGVEVVDLLHASSSAAFYQFDVFMSNSNPNAVGSFTLKPVANLQSQREIEFYGFQPSAGSSTWNLAVDLGGSIIGLTSGIPVGTWVHLVLGNDVSNNGTTGGLFWAYLNGVPLVEAAAYPTNMSFGDITGLNYAYLGNNFAGTPGQDVYIDNLMVFDSNPVPEPSLGLLLGVGALILAVARRRVSKGQGSAEVME